MNSHADHDMTTNPQRISRHMWLMLACCLAPIAAIIAVGAFGVPISTLLLAAIVLMCPLMMMFMMGGHGHGSAAQPSSPATPDNRSSPH